MHEGVRDTITDERNEVYNGIGYHHTNTNTNDDDYSNQSTVENLLMECLQYHQQQEKIRSSCTTSCINHHQDATIPTPNHESSVSVVSSPNYYFVPSTLMTPMEIPATTKTPTEQQQQQDRIDQARERAQKILLRFQQQQQPATPSVLYSKDVMNPNNNAAMTLTSNPSENNITIENNFLQQRQIGLEKEKQRKQTAMMKNFQYVMQQQQRRIELLTSRIISTTTTTLPPVHDGESPLPVAAMSQTFPAKVEHTNHDVALNRQCRDNSNRRTEKTKRRSGDICQSRDGGKNNSTNNNNNDFACSASNNNTVAIYISTHPPIQTHNDQQQQQPHLYWNESYLQQLFASYGTIRNIYLYRHKTNRNHHSSSGGGYKGDGIIVYKLIHTDTDEDDGKIQRQTLIDLICGQVRVILCDH